MFPDRCVLDGRFLQDNVAGRNLWSAVFHITPAAVLSLQTGLPARSLIYLSSLPEKVYCFILVNSHRQLGKVTSFLP
jgi:hypothetical protein